MAMDRNQLEREALNLINKGQLDKALNAYISILRVDPRDKRIRQKAGELLLRMGRPAEAIRFLREVAEGLVADGQPRPAIAIWKQLLELTSNEPEIEGQLGSCYHAAGFVPEARKHYEEAIRRLTRPNPERAAWYARQLMRATPGELPPQILLAELLESAGKAGEAFEAWRNLANEARRRGRLDEVARFLEHALKVKPDDLDTLCEVAEVRIGQNDPRQALVHIQKAHGLDNNSPRTASLLARAFESAGMPDKARPVWLHAAHLFEEEGDAVSRLDALQRAIATGADDPEIRALVGDASKAAERLALRLDDKAWAQPRSDGEVRVVVRARTLSRYGFPDRARELLLGAEPGVRRTLSARVALAEVLAEAGDAAGALAELRAAPSPIEAEACKQLDTRISVLAAAAGERADAAPQPLDELEELEEIEEIEEIDDLDAPAATHSPYETPDEPLETQDEDVEDDPTEGEEGRWESPTTLVGVKPAAARVNARPAKGLKVSVERTPLAPRPAVQVAEPAAESPPVESPRAAALAIEPPTLLPTGPATEPPAAVKAPSARASRRTTTTPEPIVESPSVDPVLAPFSGEEPTGVGVHQLGRGEIVPDDISFGDSFVAMPSFTDVFGPGGSDTSSTPSARPAALADDQTLADARALLAVGRYADARERLRGRTDLLAVLILARANHESGDHPGALRGLQDAVDEAHENDAGYLDALLLLARFDAIAGKNKAALRILNELDDHDPTWRADEAADLRRGLELMGKR